MNEQLFPPGLVVEQELTTSSDAKFGIRHFIVRDRRWNTSHAPRRQVRVFSDPGRKNWGSKLQERLERLFERPLPHVSRPLEIAETVDGLGTYVVTDWHECALAMRIAERGLVDDPHRALAWKLFGQLAEGLDALHGAGLPHGAFCPDCVGIDLTQEMAWIDGGAWGPLRHWTSGDYVPPEAIRYQAPECQGRSQDPSEKADLYALGRIGIEMLAGRPGSESSGWPGFLKAFAHERQYRLFQSLIASEPDERPTAAEVIKRARHAQCRRRALWMLRGLLVAGTLILLLGVAAAVVWYGKSAAEERAAVLAGSVATLQGTVDDLKRRNADLQGTADDLKRRNAELEANSKAPITPLPTKPQPPSPTSPPSSRSSDVDILSRATERWIELANDDRRTWESMSSLIQDLKPDEDKEVAEKIRSKLKEWRTHFEERKTKPWWIRARNVAPDVDNASHAHSVRLEIVAADSSATRDFPVSPDSWYAFDWKPGDKIRVTVYGPPRTLWWAPVFGAETLSGPVVLWQLNKHRVENKDLGVTVEFEIEDCPGPAGPKSERRLDPEDMGKAFSSQLSGGK
jgi:serine/threonine protein kinase